MNSADMPERHSSMIYFHSGNGGACGGSQGAIEPTEKQFSDTTRRGEVLPEWVLMCLFSLYVSLLA